MSKFREAREEAAAATRGARLSALQIAWLLVLLTIFAVIIWISFPASNDTSGSPQTTAIAKTAPIPQASKPATSQAAPRKALPPKVTLSPAPIADLVEKTAIGPLPRIAKDGREPWKAYARPYTDKTARPRISIVIDGLGLRKAATETAITTLPPTISLAFSPYGEGLTVRVRAARAAGHEVLLMLPMEPQDYPKNDPGPHAMLTSLKPTENITRMHWVLSRFTGYVGVVNEMGSKFTASEEAMTPILKELKSRGLLFMDARSSQYSVAGKLARNERVPRVINNRYIDDIANEEQIKKRLDEIENIAKTYGAAAALGRAHPVTMRTVAAWAADLEKRGFELVPVTAVANRQPVR